MIISDSDLLEGVGNTIFENNFNLRESDETSQDKYVSRVLLNGPGVDLNVQDDIDCENPTAITGNVAANMQGRNDEDA